MATVIQVCWRHKRRMEGDGCWICAYEQAEAEKKDAEDRALAAWCLRQKGAVVR